ncbi:MAG: colanic acid biosynthesis glycosyltransferase WcaI, partial [Alphaproteobacteria bacterium HGW-Alphaproteobacteria-16]
KIGGMLASGRRIVVTAAPDSEIATFLGDAAVLVEPAALAEAIQREADRVEARGRINDAGVALAHTISAETILSRFAAMLRASRKERR